MTSEAADIHNTVGLRWVFGLNKDLIGGVHSLCSNERKALFFIAGNTGVIYNFENHTQLILQGHRNNITCCCVSDDKRWIVTADAGHDSMILIWDSFKGIPIRTIDDPFQGGVHAIDISYDSMHIAALSNEMPQQLAIWQWTDVDSEAPSLTFEVPCNDFQNLVRFDHCRRALNPTDTEPVVLVTNGAKNVIFWKAVDASAQQQPDSNYTDAAETPRTSLSYYIPPRSSKEFRQPIGAFTQSIFVPRTTFAATATSDGDIVLWAQENTDALELMEEHEINKSALKVVRVHNSAINYLTTVGNYIVTGGEEGFVRFFDFQLRIVAWYETLDGGPITGISFYYEPERQSRFGDHLDLEDSETKKRKRIGDDADGFKCPDCIVSTTSSLVIYLTSDAFNAFDQELMRGELLLQGQEGSVQCLAVHPLQPYIAVSGLSGHLHLWDYEMKKVLLLTIFKNLQVSSICFEPKGRYLIVGSTLGTVKVLNGNTLEETQSFKSSKDAINQIVFSADSTYFATSDAENCVGIYRWGHRDEDERKPIEWVYVGRIRSHKKPIIGVQFSVTDSNGPRLISLGEDRRLVEYDLPQSTCTGGVKVRSVHRIGQSTVPTAFLWTGDTHCVEHLYTKSPFDTEQEEQQEQQRDLLLFCNDQYKFTVFTTPDDNPSTLQTPKNQPHNSSPYSSADCFCVRTILAPTFAGPLTKLLLIPNGNESEQSPDQQESPESDTETANQSTRHHRYLAYATQQKVVGLIKLPLDGKISNAMALIAHAGRITALACSPDGRYLFTAGGEDYSMYQWEINAEVFDAATQRSNEEMAEKGIDPFVELIEGGLHGEFMQEIKQYFYYAQIRSQGEVTTDQRQIQGKVPLEQVPNLMRALGFYATEYEIENIMKELTLFLDNTQGVKQNSPVNDVDLDTFIRLYVNHRPVAGIKRQDIEDAFVRLGAERVSGMINKDQLFGLLSALGETMTPNDIDACLSNLFGENVTSDSLEERFTALEFATHLLGFDDLTNEGSLPPQQQQTASAEEDSTIESSQSDPLSNRNSVSSSFRKR